MPLRKYLFFELFWALIQAGIVYTTRSDQRFFILFPVVNMACIAVAVLRLPKAQSWQSVNLHLPSISMWVGILAGLTPIMTDTWESYRSILLLGFIGAIPLNIIIYLWLNSKGFTKAIQYREIGLSVIISFLISVSLVVTINNLSDIRSMPRQGQIVEKYITSGKSSSYRLLIEDIQDSAIIDFRVKRDAYEQARLNTKVLYRSSKGLLNLKRYMIISEL